MKFFLFPSKKIRIKKDRKQLVRQFDLNEGVFNYSRSKFMKRSLFFK
jgi:hypothetical protein